MASLPQEIKLSSGNNSRILSGTFRAPFNWADIVANYALPTFPYSPRDKKWLANNMGVELAQLEPWYEEVVSGVFAPSFHSLLKYQHRERQSFTQLVVLMDYADPQTVGAVVEALGLQTEIVYRSADEEGQLYKSVNLTDHQDFLIPNFSIVECSIPTGSMPLVLERGIELGTFKK